MRRLSARYLLVNLGILCVGILPLTFAVIWVYNLLRGRYERVDLQMAVGSAFALSLTYLLPVAVGGIVHASILAGILPSSWSVARRRVGAFLLTLIVFPVVLLAFGQPSDPLLWFAPAIGVGLATYALVMRLPVAEVQ
jgi:hypothetical protein